jgi:hypothetical protein
MRRDSLFRWPTYAPPLQIIERAHAGLALEPHRDDRLPRRDVVRGLGSGVPELRAESLGELVARGVPEAAAAHRVSLARAEASSPAALAFYASLVQKASRLGDGFDVLAQHHSCLPRLLALQ